MAHVRRPRTAIPSGRRRVVFVARHGQGGIDDTIIPVRTAPGTIRRLVHTQVNSIAAPPPFSWVRNPPIITNPVRYRVSTRFRGVGSDATINAGPRKPVRWRVQQSAVTRQAGNKPSQPTVRNRLASFGSRVPSLNPPSPNVATRSVN